jgi:LuxR family quorum-sensing transcriptional regulator LasR
MAMQHTFDSCTDQVPGRTADASPTQLTAKESQALQWCLKGKTTWEIARIQNCSESTVNFHFSNIRRKFEVNSRAAALVKAIEMGLITVEPVDSGGYREPD